MAVKDQHENALYEKRKVQVDKYLCKANKILYILKLENQ